MNDIRCGYKTFETDLLRCLYIYNICDLLLTEWIGLCSFPYWYSLIQKRYKNRSSGRMCEFEAAALAIVKRRGISESVLQ